MKTTLLFYLLSLSCIVNGQWLDIKAFSNSTESLIACNNNLYAGLAGGGVYTSQDSGATWFAVNNGIQFGGGYVFSLTSNNDSIYAGVFGEVYFTDDNGANWSSLNLNLSLNNFVYALVPKDNYIFAGVGNDTSNNGVYRKQINSSTWTQVNNGLPNNISVNAFVVNTNSIFAGSDSGVYVSIDNGLNWSLSNNGITAGHSIKSLHVVNGNLLAGTINGVYASTDNGKTWNFTNGLPSNTVVTSITSNNNNVLAGTYNGIFSSTDNGLNWTNFSGGLESNSVFSLLAFGNYYYAGNGNKIFSTKPGLATSASENNEHSNDTWSVYPNPFSSQATLQAGVFLRNATLTFYNSNGKSVQEIKNISGHTIGLSRNNLPTGIYFLQLSENNNVITTTKILITERP